MGKDGGMNSDPETLEKELRVVQLRRLGLTFDMIATEVGYANPSGAYKAFRRGVKEIVVEDIQEIRTVELERLDLAQRAIMAAVAQGRIPAINTMLRLMERRARLLGLDAPVKHELEVNYFERDIIDSEYAELVNLYRNHKESILGIGEGENGTTTEEE